MEYISAVEVNNKIEKGESVQVIDIRESYELDICKVDSFLHIPMADVETRLNEIRTDVPVVICCRSGKRALAVANLLMQDHDLSNVSILEGGILAWREDVDNTLEAY